MKKVPCSYCGKLNLAKPKASKKNCNLCFYWGNKIKDKPIPRKEKIKIVCWAINQKQKCVSCGSNKRLGFDRIVPSVMGGKYELKNVQIMCYTCNSCIKTHYKNIEEAQKTHTEKECRVCKSILPLNDTHWHRTPYVAKYRDNSAAQWHGTCKKCRLVQEKQRYTVSCDFCKKTKKTWTKTAKYCGKECMSQAISERGRKKIKCMCCDKEWSVLKSSKRKYCGNTCSSKHKKRDKEGRFLYEG